MKKTILSLLLIGCSYAMFAQQTRDTTRKDSIPKSDSSSLYNNPSRTRTDSTMSSMNNNNLNNPSVNRDTMNRMNNNNSLSSNNAYNAYGTSVAIPYRAQMNLQKDYPMAASSNITWTRNGDWYHGTYLNNGRYSHIYYDDKGNTYSVSMPVTETYVPDDILTKATSTYGPAIYDITSLKGNNGQNIYQVRTLENGQVKAQWVGDDGSAVADPFRSDINTETNTGANPNAHTDSTNLSHPAYVNPHTDSSSMKNNNEMNHVDSASMNRSKDSTWHNKTTDSTAHSMNSNWNAAPHNNSDSTVSRDSTQALPKKY
ncbi:MAG: hypothetical protein ACXVBR_05720 [Flavisolibacter sp.]